MKQIQITSKAPKRERAELDLRTPSGRRLPYESAHVISRRHRMFATQRTFDSQPDSGCATVRTPRSLPAALGVTYRALHRWFAQSQLGPVDNYVIR